MRGLKLCPLSWMLRLMCLALVSCFRNFQSELGWGARPLSEPTLNFSPFLQTPSHAADYRQMPRLLCPPQGQLSLLDRS